MTTVTIENPHKVESKKVDSSGKVYVGRDIAGQNVQVVIGEVDADDDDDETEEDDA